MYFKKHPFTKAKELQKNIDIVQKIHDPMFDPHNVYGDKFKKGPNNEKSQEMIYKFLTNELINGYYFEQKYPIVLASYIQDIPIRIFKSDTDYIVQYFDELLQIWCNSDTFPL
jgi:hypothetical protein